MDLIMMVIMMVVLFGVIYWAVHLAIEPLIRTSSSKSNIDKNILLKLRSKGIVTEDELNDYKDIEQFGSEFNQLKDEYIHAKRMYKALKEANRLNEEEYLIKIKKLEKYYDMK